MKNFKINCYKALKDHSSQGIKIFVSYSFCTVISMFCLTFRSLNHYNIKKLKLTFVIKKTQLKPDLKGETCNIKKCQIN